MAEDFGEKTEDATPRRRQEAREEGNIAKSQDLTAAASLLAGIVLLYLLGRRVLGPLKQDMEVMLGHGAWGNPTRADHIDQAVYFTAEAFLRSLAPIALAIAAVALLVTVAQVGFIITGKPLTPKFSKLDPIKGTQNLFSARAFMRLVMSLGKIILIAAIAIFVIYRDIEWMLLMADMEVLQAFAAGASLVFALALKLAVVLLVLALIDYIYQRWQREKDLRMSKQEVKDDMKRMEGDPLVKQRRARVARQLAMQRISQAVPGADVIVTNPTHFSVALKYDSDNMRAPKVVAKGADHMAMKIRQIATAHGIPIVERKPLARALYWGVEIGQEIPPEHYTAVAEILAYVYRLGSQRKSA